MTNDLMKLMAYIDSLQSEPTPEPVIETEETKVHPLLQAMQELKEDGIVESVDAHTIYSIVQSGHREPEDFIEGDIGDRIYWFDDYKKTSLPISNLNLDEHYVDDELVDDYVELIKSSPNTMPPIVFDPIANSIIDGIHRANAYAKLGYDTIPAYVGLTKSDTYGEREEIYEATDDIKDQIEKAIIVDGGNWDEYFVRSSQVDKIGYSTKQQYGRSPDLDHPDYDIDYIGSGKGKPALWFYPVSYYLKKKDVFGQEYPYIWLVRLRPDAWLQPVDRFTKSIQDAPQGKERVGILKKRMIPAAIFFKPAFDVVDKFVNYKSLHKPHGLVKGPQVDEEIAYHGTVDDINEFHPFTHFGTEKAAKDRMEYKKIKDGKIYQVDLDIKNPLQIKDFPGIHYDRQYAFELRDKGLISQEEMEAITFIQDKQELRKALLNKLNELGIDGFVYKNKYEDKGNISYVIVDPSQVKVLSVEPAAEEVSEASPNTLEGSFTPDLVESKTWLAKMLAKGLKGKNAGTIYVLGSWYGNMGIFLQQADVKFDKLVLIEPNEDWLMRSKDLLDTLNDEGKLVLIHQKAEDVVYEKPGVVINTSCNETGPVFLTKLPDNMLCLLQARNNVDNVLIETDNLEEFKDLFSLNKIYYAGEKHLTDPETDYTRYMIIGRTGKKLDETISTGQGGGSAGVGGGQMVGGPTTYEEEYGMFKSKGPRRITAMTNEALDSSYPYEGKAIGGRYTFETEDGVFYKVYFQGKDLVEIAFSAILPGEEENFRPDKTTITGTGNSRKVFGTVVKIVQDYVEAHKPKALYFISSDEPSRLRLYQTMTDQVGKALPDYYAVKPTDLGDGKAFMLKRKTKKVDEALDSSYEYRNSNLNPGKIFYFDTEDGSEYKVQIEGDAFRSEVVFAQRGQGDEAKVGITGTGNSRKIFGTVVNIVQNYINRVKPELLTFTANNNEPSRLRLYKTLASQADKVLTNYKFVDALNDGLFTTYYLARSDVKVPVLDKIKAAGYKTLDKIIGESTIVLANKPIKYIDIGDEDEPS